MSSKPVCLVVGGGPGIGYSVARKWAANGYQVVLTKRGALNQQELERDCCKGVVALQADVTDEKRMKEVVEEVESKYGQIQTLVYNAGSGVFKKYDSLTVAELEIVAPPKLSSTTSTILTIFTCFTICFLHFLQFLQFLQLLQF